MNKRSRQGVLAFRFRRWSRKAYAAFCSIGRCVTIGRVCKSIAEASLLKVCAQWQLLCRASLLAEDQGLHACMSGEEDVGRCLPCGLKAVHEQPAGRETSCGEGVTCPITERIIQLINKFTGSGKAAGGVSLQGRHSAGVLPLLIVSFHNHQEYDNRRIKE